MPAIPPMLFALLAAVLTLTLGTQAQTFQAASDQALVDLNAALTELADVRESIAAEKIPQMRAVATLEDEVRQQSAELQRQQRLRDNNDLGLNQLREQVKAIEAQHQYTTNLLDEFARSFETRIDFSETQLYAQSAERARLAVDDPNLSAAERFEQQIDVLHVALDRLQQLVGGYTFDGLALTPQREIETGTFAAFGPVVYFASEQTDLTGICYNQLNAAETAIAVPGLGSSGLRQLIETGHGSIPADATLGKALQIQQDGDSIGEHLAKGGSVGVVILMLGGVCLCLGVLKAFEIAAFQTPAAESVHDILAALERGDLAHAQRAARALPGAGGTLLVTGLQHVDERRGTLEEILYEKILAVRPQLERFLPFIALTAAAAPLLGLLGTVTGMIKTFNLITLFGSGDAKSLSSGISEALVTTELGLLVAIPALILHGVLTRMTRQKIGAMEQTALGFINGVVATRHSKQPSRA
jgi:biopolymer transport protein ExbB